jgi:hypothetical protein
VNALIALLFVLASIALAVLPRRDAATPGWTLLRCFFPSWRFFEEIDPAPLLSYRLADSEPPGAWRAADLSPPPRRAGDLLLHPNGNLQLAYRSLIERLLSELDAPDPTVLVSYQLLRHLVTTELMAERAPAQGARYQFRLCSGDDGSELFVSAIHDR